MKDRIPTVGEHRGVGLHAWQDADRLADVRADIDEAFGLDGAEQLFKFAADPSRAPEARLLAAARARAIFELAAERREFRPDVNLDHLDAVVAGIDCLRWMDPAAYGSLLDNRARQVMRPRPLTDEEVEAARA